VPPATHELNSRTQAPVSPEMRCKNCGEREFLPAEYRSGGVSAPAIECAHCHVLNLDEEAAHTEEERDSVRLAVALRVAVIEEAASPPSTPPRS